MLRLPSVVVDEVMGRVALYLFMRYYRMERVKGETRKTFPDLFGGDVEKFFQPAPRAIDIKSGGKPFKVTDEYTLENTCFQSSINSTFPHNDVVCVSRWRPNVGDKGLTVIGCEGIVQIGKTWFTWLAESLTRSGVEVVMMDPAFNFRRTPPGYLPGQLILGGDADHQLAVARQQILDLATLVRSIQAEGRRVGLVGCSYGGWMVLVAAMLLDHLDFVMAIAPAVDVFAQLSFAGPITSAVRHGLNLTPELIPLFEHGTRPVRPNLHEPFQSDVFVQIHQAIYDRFVPTWPQEELASRWRAQVTRHRSAHYPLACNSRLWRHVAHDILDRWQLPQRSDRLPLSPISFRR